MATIRDIQKRWELGQSAESILQEYQDKKDPYNAWITKTPELWKESLEKQKSPESRGLLYGIPVALKDNIQTQGYRMTCGDKILSSYISPFDATVVTKLKQAGAAILGKVNMDGFALGSSGAHSYFGKVLNPISEERIVGGSSSGSCASVSGDLAVLSLGSDTGGSVRLPAAFNGLVGMKPTYGSISRYGVVAMSSSLDQIGPIANNVEDLSKLFHVLQGKDVRDPNSIAIQFDYKNVLKEVTPQQYRIGFLENIEKWEGFQPEVLDAYLKVIHSLKEKGFQLVPVDLPHWQYAIDVYVVISRVELASALAMFDGIRYGDREPAESIQDLFLKTRGAGFVAEAKKRVLLGTYYQMQGDSYHVANQVRTILSREVHAAFQVADIFLTPTNACIAPKWTQKLTNSEEQMLDLMTSLGNLTGIPAVSIPMPWKSEGQYMGLQVMSYLKEDEKMLHFAHYLEQMFQQTSL